MTIQASEIQGLLKQANPASPDAPTPQEAAEVQQNAPLSPQAQGGIGALSARGPQSPTNAVPARSFAPDMHAPGSFSQKFFDALKVLGPSPVSMVAAGAHAGSSAPVPTNDANAPGSTTFEAAQQDDTTKPTTTPQAPRSNVVSRGIKGVLANLGDAAAATENGGAGGFFGGFARAAQAGTQRTAQEMKDREAMAVSNAQMIHEQALAHKLGEDQIAAAIQSGKAGLDLMLKAHVPGTLLYSDKTSDQIHDMLKIDPATGKSQIDPSMETVFLTGRIQTGTDANGLPQFRSTYSVVRPGGPVTFDESNKDDLDYINDQLHMKIGYDKDGKFVGQQLPAVQVNQLWQQAQGAEVAKAARDTALAEQGLKKAEIDIKTEGLTIGHDPLVQQAMSQAAKMTTNKSYIPPIAYGLLMSSPPGPDGRTFLQNHPNFTTTFPSWAGGGNPKNFDVLNDQYAKAQDKSEQTAKGILQEVAKDPIKMQNNTSAVMAAAKAIFSDPDKKGTEEEKEAKRVYQQAQDVRDLEVQLAGEKELAKDKMKKGASERSNPNGLTGIDFIKTLPVGRQKSLEAIYRGSLPINPAALERTDKGQAFLDDIYTAYPDFASGENGAYKAMEWPKAYADAMANGKVYQAKGNYNTALRHMDEIYRTSTFDGLYTPWTKDYQDRHAALAIVTGEMAKAVKAGVATEAESEALKSALSGGWKTPGDAKERAAEQTRLLKEKIDEYQYNFQQAAPSQFIKVPTLISPEAQKAYDYVQNGGKESQPNQTATPSKPAPTTHVFDSRAWAAANPGKDVNAAIAQAKQQGYEVK